MERICMMSCIEKCGLLMYLFINIVYICMMSSILKCGLFLYFYMNIGYLCDVMHLEMGVVFVFLYEHCAIWIMFVWMVTKVFTVSEVVFLFCNWTLVKFASLLFWEFLEHLNRETLMGITLLLDSFLWAYLLVFFLKVAYNTMGLCCGKHFLCFVTSASS